jgi:hypothetical protein
MKSPEFTSGDFSSFNMTIDVNEIRSDLEPRPDDDSPLENGLKSIADDADLDPVHYWSSDHSDCPDCFFLQTLADGH